MPQPTIDYISTTFSLMPEHSGHLAILITEWNCSLAVGTSSGVLSLYKAFQRDSAQLPHEFVKEIFTQENELINRRFNNVSVGIQTVNFTILPNSLSIDPVVAMNELTNSPTRVVQSQQLKQLNATFAYSIPAPLQEVLTHHLPDFDYSHCLPTIINEIDSIEEDGVIVIGNQYFDLLILKENQLISVTRHPFESVEDILYFTLLGLEDAEISPQEASINVKGNLKQLPSLTNALSDYIQTVSSKKETSPIEIRYDYEFDEQPNEYVLNLLHANY